MSFTMTEEAILEEYRKKITPEGRRLCIKSMATANQCSAYEIAEFLLEQGEQVDGRMVRRKPTLSDPGWVPFTKRGEPADPEPAQEPDPDPVEASEEAPAPDEPASAEETKDEPCMTAGVLAALLSKVDPEATVLMDSEGYVSAMHVSVIYDETGERAESHVVLLPQGW